MMTKWVLILTLVGPYYGSTFGEGVAGTGTAIETIEFTSRDRCLSAAKLYLETMGTLGKAMCVEKD